MSSLAGLDLTALVLEDDAEPFDVVAAASRRVSLAEEKLTLVLSVEESEQLKEGGIFGGWDFPSPP